MARKVLVTGDHYRGIVRKLREIKRQIDQGGGYPFSLDNLSGGLQLLVEGRPVGVPCTFDSEGNIHLLVASSNITWDQWRVYFERRGWPSDDLTNKVVSLSSISCPVTNGFVYHVVICPFPKAGIVSTLKNAWSYAEGKNWKIPHWEVACLLGCVLPPREVQMLGLDYVVVAHQPFSHDGGSFVLSLGSFLNANKLVAFTHNPNHIWPRKCGFAFVV